MKYEIEIHALRPDGLARNGEPAKVFTVKADCGIDHLAEMYQILTGMTGLHRVSLADLHNTATNRLFDKAIDECSRILSPDYRDDLNLDQGEIAAAIKYGKILADGCTGWAAAANSWRDKDQVEACEFFDQFEETT